MGASLTEALKVLYGLEFSNRPELFLHYNKGEEGYTLGGIYRKYNPQHSFWAVVESTVTKCRGNLREASKELFANQMVRDGVEKVYRELYWGKMRLDEVQSQKIAEEIFVMGVVAGVTVGVKLAQELVGVVADGIIGSKTIAALNAFDEDKFDVKYDELEIDFFEKLAASKPHLAKNLKGWKNRAQAV